MVMLRCSPSHLAAVLYMENDLCDSETDCGKERERERERARGREREKEREREREREEDEGSGESMREGERQNQRCRDRSGVRLSMECPQMLQCLTKTPGEVEECQQFGNALVEDSLDAGSASRRWSGRDCLLGVASPSLG